MYYNCLEALTDCPCRFCSRLPRAVLRLHTGCNAAAWFWMIYKCTPHAFACMMIEPHINICDSINRSKSFCQLAGQSELIQPFESFVQRLHKYQVMWCGTPHWQILRSGINYVVADNSVKLSKKTFYTYLFIFSTKLIFLMSIEQKMMKM